MPDTPETNKAPQPNPKFNHAFSMCGRALPYADEERAKLGGDLYVRCAECGATYPDYYDECPRCGSMEAIR